MRKLSSKTIRRFAMWTLTAVLVVSVALWFTRRNTLPGTVRIATGESGGLYHDIGIALKSGIAERTHRPVEIQTTNGSIDNLRKLLAGEVDLAVIQGGSVRMDDVSVVSPLFPELLLVIVRRDQGMEVITDLTDRTISLAKEGSGSRESARRVLEHFHISDANIRTHDRYIRRLLDDPTLDAAIVTAGIGHDDLSEVLDTGQFELLPVEDADAIDMLHPYLRSTEVPRGLFGEQPPVPERATPTIATTAYLVALPDAPDALIDAALKTIHEGNLRLEIPTLIPRDQASARVPTRLHPVAQRYFNPADQIGYMANIMESLAATKELLFALGAGLYLLWLRWRSLKAKETQELISRQKEHLDLMLEQTLRIEESQTRSTNPEELQKLLEKVTRIKLRALHEFTEEELRGDHTFSIFLMQCGNLISKIQLKILSLDREQDVK